MEDITNKTEIENTDNKSEIIVGLDIGTTSENRTNPFLSLNSKSICDFSLNLSTLDISLKDIVK